MGMITHRIRSTSTSRLFLNIFIMVLRITRKKAVSLTIQRPQ